MTKMAVWLDGNEARIFHVDGARFEEVTVRAPQHHIHRHPKDEATRSHDHPADEQRYFHQIAQAFAGATEILVIGPSITKLHLQRYLQKHDPALESRIVGLETADHPTDRQIVAHVRKYFHDSPPRVAF